MSAAPVLDQLVLDACGVAALLSLSEQEFLTKRPRLQRLHGFPRVLPGLERRWSRAAVEAWIAGPDRADVALEEISEETGLPALPTIDPVADAAARLRRKYGAGPASPSAGASALACAEVRDAGPNARMQA